MQLDVEQSGEYTVLVVRAICIMLRTKIYASEIYFFGN